MDTTIDRHMFRRWVPFAIVITILCGLVYVAVQQSFRMTANDPQISLAEEISRDLSSAPNADAQQTILNQLQNGLTMRWAPGKTDISESLEPFVIVYDATGKPIASSGQLNGQVPTPPAGVFSYVSAGDEDRFTWQPQSDVRVATVVSGFKTTLSSSAISSSTSTPVLTSGFVLAGRSLREVEQRESSLTLAVFAAWLAALIFSFFALFL